MASEALNTKVSLPKIKIIQLDAQQQGIDFILGPEFTLGQGPGVGMWLPLNQPEIFHFMVSDQFHFKVSGSSQKASIQYNNQIGNQAEIPFGARFSLQGVAFMLENMEGRSSEVPLSMREDLPEYQWELNYGFSKRWLWELTSLELNPKQQVWAQKIADHLGFENIYEPFIDAKKLKSFTPRPLWVRINSGPEKGNERRIESIFFTIGREGDDIPLSHESIDIAHILVEQLPERKLLIKKLLAGSAGKIDGRDFEALVIDEQSKLVLGESTLTFEYESSSEELAQSSEADKSELENFQEEMGIELVVPLESLKNLGNK